MVAAYATFANQGLRMKPMLVTRITDRDGNVIEENRPAGPGRHPRRHRLHHDEPAPRRGRARHRRPGQGPEAPHRGQDGHHQRLHRRLVHRLRAVAVRRGVGGLRREEGLAGQGRDGRARGPAHLDGLLEARDEGQAHRGVLHPRATSSSCPWTRWAGPGHAGMPGVQMEAFVAGTEPRFSSSDQLAGPS